MGIRASLSFRYIAPTTRTAKSSILTPKIAKIPFAETGWLETAPSATPSCAKTRPFRNRPQISSLDALGIRAESRVFRAAELTSYPRSWRMNK